MAGKSYPNTPKGDAIDTYFGHEVSDPYRWLEDDNAENVAGWVKKQNEFTQAYLNQAPFRDQLKQQYEKLFDFPRVSGVRKVGEYIFFHKNTGLQNQAVIWFQKGLEGEKKIFLNPNTFSETGTTAVNIIGFSQDKKYAALSVSEAGSDWSEIIVREIETGKNLQDNLKWVKFSAASWDGDGFYYTAYTPPEKGKEFSATTTGSAIYFHRLGQAQSEDQLIFSQPEHPRRYLSASVTEDRNFLILYISTGTDGYETYFKNLKQEGAEFQALYTGFKHKNNVISHFDGYFWVHTDVDAASYKLVKVAVAQAEQAQWEEVIAEREDLLEGVVATGGKLFAHYLKKASTRIVSFDEDGENEKEIELPGLGTAELQPASREAEFTFFSFNSFTNPGTVYIYDISSAEYRIYYQPPLTFDPDAFESKQVFYPSKDGTMVSMFVVHKKGLVLDGNRPCYLYGYGGFNINLSAGFNVSRMLMLLHGFVFAMPNLRGGGEYGESWHRAGMLKNKHKVFEDFIAAAEYLIEAGYSSPDKMAIAGGSNGGLLVGACANMRPDLFRAAMPAVGVMDMLRYHKFTVGWGWIPEYGSSEADEEMFLYLKNYSPIHNIQKNKTYPAVLVTTADHDDRVVPAHSFKYIAELQAAAMNQSRPRLIRIDIDAGHGAGKPMDKIIETLADQLAFLFFELDVESDIKPD